MYKKELQLSDIQRPNANVPYINARSLYGAADRNDQIVGNTTIEDMVKSNPENLFQGDIAQRLARLEDKKNQYSRVKADLKNIDQIVAEQNYGMGVTQLGQKAQSITQARGLEAKGDLIAADIEELRGNIETAQELRKKAESLSRKSNSKSSTGFDTIIGDTQSTTGTTGFDKNKYVNVILENAKLNGYTGDLSNLQGKTEGELKLLLTDISNYGDTKEKRQNNQALLRNTVSSPTVSNAANLALQSVTGLPLPFDKLPFDKIF